MLPRSAILVIIGIGFGQGVAADHLCTALGGTCQDDSLICSGSYYTGKCSGIATRRCCTPTPQDHCGARSMRSKESYTADCTNVQIISRDSWGARRPKGSSTLTTPVPDVFIHHTETPACADFTSCVGWVKSIQNHHMDNNNWDDIGYSFLVGEDGNVYEGRGWDKVGAHTSGYNSKSFGVAFIGDFQTETPNAGALQAATRLISCCVTLQKISVNWALFGHRDVVGTACPGDALYNIIKACPRFQAHAAK